ncbi:MAG TPA: archaeal proteasome endopeptidase complex subunit alpha [Patescibacteria group bacterium]|nr:archaeal proteasome endopeptidase complex subunit alpha [Patescibacteria group bacterium]
MSVFAAPGAYDRAITVFSPDGRLFQVEYAMELVNRGATILALRCAGGVVLGAEETIDPLEESEYSWKIFKIDDHVGTAIVGLSSDARILIDQARVHAQSNKLTYDEPIDTEVVTKRICDIKQLYTQHAGVRPFGVSMIFAGVDKTGPRVFGTHPSGTYRGYKARAEGAGRETVFNILKEEYKEDMELENVTKLAVKCLTKALEARQLPPRIKVAVTPLETKKMTVLADEKVEGIMKQLGVGK